MRRKNTSAAAEAERLLAKARNARESAYAPYSGFRVGAALSTARGDIYVGCNVENASYSLAICAERTALFRALCDGQSKFTALAVVVDAEDLATPCGACRQVLSEFADDLVITLGNLDGKVETYRLAELFPSPFELRRERS
jgi:cytidine deaminase